MALTAGNRVRTMYNLQKTNRILNWEDLADYAGSTQVQLWHLNFVKIEIT